MVVLKVNHLILRGMNMLSLVPLAKIGSDGRTAPAGIAVGGYRLLSIIQAIIRREMRVSGALEELGLARPRNNAPWIALKILRNVGQPL